MTTPNSSRLWNLDLQISTRNLFLHLQVNKSTQQGAPENIAPACDPDQHCGDTNSKPIGFSTQQQK